MLLKSVLRAVALAASALVSLYAEAVNAAEIQLLRSVV